MTIEAADARRPAAVTLRTPRPVSLLGLLVWAAVWAFTGAGIATWQFGMMFGGSPLVAAAPAAVMLIPVLPLVLWGRRILEQDKRTALGV